MCNPSTERPISEAMPLVNAIIAEVERDCIDIEHLTIIPLPEGRFDIAIYAYDGGEQALTDRLGLIDQTHYQDLDGHTKAATRRTVGRWSVHSSRRLPTAEEVAA